MRQHAKFEDELGNSTQPNDTNDDEARSLPSGWTERSHNGRAFYVNTVTGERTWVRPDDTGDDEAPSLPSGWTERSHNGRAFYVNTVTGERTWVRPDDTGSAKTMVEANPLAQRPYDDATVIAEVEI